MNKWMIDNLLRLAGVCAVVIALVLTISRLPGLTGQLARAGAFYAGALLALVALRWIRKGDVTMAILVLAAACETARGRPFDLLYDAAGVALAVAPVWAACARYAPRRRAADRRPQSRPRPEIRLQAWVVAAD